MKKLLLSVCMVTSVSVQFMCAEIDKNVLNAQLKDVVYKIYVWEMAPIPPYEGRADSLAQGDQELAKELVIFFGIHDDQRAQEQLNKITTRWQLEPIIINDLRRR